MGSVGRSALSNYFYLNVRWWADAPMNSVYYNNSYIVLRGYQGVPMTWPKPK